MVVIEPRRRCAISGGLVGAQAAGVRPFCGQLSQQALPIQLSDVRPTRGCGGSSARNADAGLQEPRSTARPRATEGLGLSHCEERLSHEAAQEHLCTGARVIADRLRAGAHRRWRRAANRNRGLVTPARERFAALGIERRVEERDCESCRIYTARFCYCAIWKGCEPKRRRRFWK